MIIERMMQMASLPIPARPSAFLGFDGLLILLDTSLMEKGSISIVWPLQGDSCWSGRRKTARWK